MSKPRFQIYFHSGAAREYKKLDNVLAEIVD